MHVSAAAAADGGSLEGSVDPVKLDRNAKLIGKAIHSDIVIIRDVVGLIMVKMNHCSKSRRGEINSLRLLPFF